MFHRGGVNIPRHRSQTPAPVVIRPVDHRQLLLVDPTRDLVAGRRRGFPPPPDPLLDAALRAHVEQHGQQHGWDTCTVQPCNARCEYCWEPRTPLARRSTPPMSPRCPRSGCPVRPTLEVLTSAGMLLDNRRPALLRWADSQLAELPEQIRAELGVWIEVMRTGNPAPPRRRPRSEKPST